MILKQRMSYAEITLIKNYSHITYVDGKVLMLDNKGKIGIHLPSFPTHGPKTKYYYGGNSREQIFTFQTFKKIFTTLNEKHIKNHFGNPFASISVFVLERTMELRGNKLYMKIYRHTKERRYNSKYFKKTSLSVFFTIDIMTGNFTIGIKTTRGVKKDIIFRKNSFSHLFNILNDYKFFNYSNKINNFYSNKEITKKYLEIFNDFEFFNEFKKHIDTPPTSNNNIENEDIFEFIVNFFIRKKKIKTPDNYLLLFKKYYPTEKYLKKNNRKLVQSILDSFGIKSNLTIKIAHENPYLNYYEFTLFCGLFGKSYMKYIGNLYPNVIKLFFTSKKNSYYIGINGRKPPKNHYFINSISDEEKENIIKIVNSLVLKINEHYSVGDSIFTLFRDHFEMIEKVRDYYPDFKMTATTYESFHNEHLELSKIISSIKRGWEIEYQYDSRMIRFIEEEVKTIYDGVSYTFTPVVLKRLNEYQEEGKFMKHCVESYIDKELSLIISLRVKNERDRVTCEFNKKTGDVSQVRYFSNNEPPIYFNEPLSILKKRVKKFAYQRLLEHVNVKKVRIKINGKEVIRDNQLIDFNDLLNPLLDDF